MLCRLCRTSHARSGSFRTRNSCDYSSTCCQRTRKSLTLTLGTSIPRPSFDNVSLVPDSICSTIHWRTYPRARKGEKGKLKLKTVYSDQGQLMNIFTPCELSEFKLKLYEDQARWLLANITLILCSIEK